VKDNWSMIIGHMGGGGADKERIERKSTWRNTCRCGNLSTTNSTRNNVISKPVLRSERQTTNRMRHYINFMYTYCRSARLVHDRHIGDEIL
jgi:hypothetical protein